MSVFRQGDIVSCDFDPTRGHEPAGSRPALVLSVDRFNENTSLVVVAPITRTDTGFPLHLPLPDGVQTEGFVCLEQLRSLDLIARRAHVVESLDNEALEGVIKVLQLFF